LRSLYLSVYTYTLDGTHLEKVYLSDGVCRQGRCAPLRGEKNSALIQRRAS
jgi:hypothetical protein